MSGYDRCGECFAVVDLDLAAPVQGCAGPSIGVLPQECPYGVADDPTPRDED